jgi:L-lactate dehydrogenase complex protein LldG
VSGKEEMLTKIRAALGRGEASEPAQNATLPDLPPARLADVMPAIAPADLLDKFEQEVSKVSGVAHRASSAQELDEILRGILESAKATSVVLSRNPLLARLQLGERLRARGLEADEWPATGEQPSKQAREAYREACFEAVVGITGVDWALAETGSLVVTSTTEGSQLSSLAPPVHVALYRRAQLAESLDDILERLPLAANPPECGRSVVFVTGVSRTADIEQILIRGVHGPRELHVLLVEESCLGQSALVSR